MNLYMNDFYSASGTTLKGFRRVLNEFEDNLVHRYAAMEDMRFSVMQPGAGTMACPIDEENFDRIKNAVEFGVGTAPVLEDFSSLAEEEPELFEENRTRSGLFLTVGDERLFVSGNALPTIGNRLGLGGTRYEARTFSRNLRIAQALREMPDRTKVLLVMLKRADRDEGNLNGMKLIAMPSTEYVHIPLTWIISIALRFAKDKTLGRPRIVSWTVTHKLVTFEMEFPEYASELKEEFGFRELLIPGIRIETSPVTRRSFDVIGTFRPEGGYVIDDSCVRQGHRGRIDINSYVDQVQRTVLASIRRLSGELGRKIGSPLSESGDAEERRAAYRRAIHAGIEGLRLASPRVLGERRAAEIRDGLLEEFSPDIPYTEYDIAMTFLHLAGRIDPLPNEIKKTLRTVCRNAPFLDYRPSRIMLLPD